LRCRQLAESTLLVSRQSKVIIHGQRDFASATCRITSAIHAGA
jgi:hypothetical protein